MNSSDSQTTFPSGSVHFLYRLVQPDELDAVVDDLTAASVPVGPTDIPADSAHEFATYELLLEFLKLHAATCGFEIRPKPSGGAAKTSRSGKIRCWCWAAPSANSDPPVLSVPSRRNYHGKMKFINEAEMPNF